MQVRFVRLRIVRFFLVVFTVTTSLLDPMQGWAKFVYSMLTRNFLSFMNNVVSRSDACSCILPQKFETLSKMQSMHEI